MNRFSSDWTGSAEDCEAARAFGREYAWEVEIADPEHAADCVIAQLGDLDPEAEGILRETLEDSAKRDNPRSPVHVCTGPNCCK